MLLTINVGDKGHSGGMWSTPAKGCMCRLPSKLVTKSIMVDVYLCHGLYMLIDFNFGNEGLSTNGFMCRCIQCR